MSFSLEDFLEFQQYLKERKGQVMENVNRRAPPIDAEQLGLSCVTESNSNEDGSGDFLVDLAIVGPALAGDPICEVASMKIIKKEVQKKLT